MRTRPGTFDSQDVVSMILYGAALPLTKGGNPLIDPASYAPAPLIAIPKMISVIFGATRRTPFIIRGGNEVTISSPVIPMRFALVLALFTSLAKVLDDEEEIALKFVKAVRSFLSRLCFKLLHAPHRKPHGINLFISSIQIMCDHSEQYANQIGSQNLKFPKTWASCPESPLPWSSQSMYGMVETGTNISKDHFIPNFVVR